MFRVWSSSMTQKTYGLHRKESSLSSTRSSSSPPTRPKYFTQFPEMCCVNRNTQRQFTQLHLGLCHSRCKTQRCICCSSVLRERACLRSLATDSWCPLTSLRFDIEDELQAPNQIKQFTKENISKRSQTSALAKGVFFEFFQFFQESSSSAEIFRSVCPSLRAQTGCSHRWKICRRAWGCCSSRFVLVEGVLVVELRALLQLVSVRGMRV
jgi:hypothetical protein